MYAEEYLPDDAMEYYDVSDVSIDETSSMDTDMIERKKMTELNKRADKDYYSYKIAEFDGETTRRIKIEVYSSPATGYIRNASTGIRMDHRVGSKYEDLYFRVADRGMNTRTPVNQEARKLFYNNPEECERHQRITLSTDIKEKWHLKQMTAKVRMLQ
jgi:hypothetical protein